MQKLKDFIREYGIYLVIAAVFFGTGYFKARYNVVIVSESQWHELIKADKQVKEMQEDEERQLLIRMME